LFPEELKGAEAVRIDRQGAMLVLVRSTARLLPWYRRDDAIKE
jgi:hypothetical protein